MDNRYNSSGSTSSTFRLVNLRKQNAMTLNESNPIKEEDETETTSVQLNKSMTINQCKIEIAKRWGLTVISDDNKKSTTKSTPTSTPENIEASNQQNESNTNTTDETTKQKNRNS